LSHSSTYQKLLSVWDNFDFKKKYDRPVKVAVLDTGLDVTHPHFQNPRLTHFVGGKPVWSSEQEPSQYDRIKACEDFTGDGPITRKDDMKDLDGHGTQVSELILRLAPRSELYIARICEGEIGTPTRSAPTGNPVKRPRPNIVARAIDWAREQKVDIINMSFGFHDRHKDVKAALNRAVRDSKILVFAAMSNDGNNSQHAAWPARDPNLAIGVHSCDKWGRKTSGFTPRYVHGSHNFMFVGEEVITMWPEAKGGGFRLNEGTSFAAPAVAAMAALILGFAWQHMCRKERDDAENQRGIDLDELRELGGMEKVLERISEKDETLRYSYIHPRLLWKDLNPSLVDDRSKVRQHAWSIIADSLSL
jgi:subtilisin family serine protease